MLYTLVEDSNQTIILSTYDPVRLPGDSNHLLRSSTLEVKEVDVDQREDELEELAWSDMVGGSDSDE